MSAETLVWDLLAVDKASGVLKKVSQAFEDSDTRTQKAAKVSGMALAGAAGAAVLLGKESIGAAGDLAETTSKVSVLFGNQAAAIDKWAETADTALGQSQQSALDAAATFATFGKSAGLQGAALTDFSTDLTGLASDMASFSNTTPEQAIEAIGAALRGESEPIRQYGVLLDDATLRAQALKLGLIKTTKDALTPQQKVLAAQAAILQQTTAAQGDFARTSSGAANKQRILSAEVANLSAKAGSALLPAFSAVLGVLTATVSVVSHHTTLFAVLAGVLATVAAVTWTVNAANTAWQAGAKLAAAATKVWTAIQWAWNAAMSANPIGLVIAGIVALVAAMVIAYKKSDTFRAIVDGAFRAVGAAFSWLWGAAKAVFGWLQSHWLLIATILTGPFGLAIGLIVKHWDGIRKGVTEGATKVVDFVRTLPKRILDAVGDLSGLLKGAGKALMQGLIDGIGSMIGKVGDAAGAVANKVKGFFGGSPVEEGPLLPWNNGGVGRHLVGMLAQGLRDVDPVADATSNLAGLIDTKVGGLRVGGLGASVPQAAQAQAPVVLQVTVQALDPTPAVGRLVVDAIERHLTRGGRVPTSVRTALAR